MKVLFVTHGFPPIQHSGTFRSEAFVRYLPAYGVHPLVICAAEPLGTVSEYTQQDIEPIENRDSIRVVRLPWKQIADTQGKFYGPIIAQRFPVVNSCVRHHLRTSFVRRVGKKVLDMYQTRNAAAIYASAPPCESLLLARHLSETTGLPYVCDLRDPWTYFSHAKYRSYLDFVYERKTEKATLNSAARVIANTETARQQLIDEIGIDEKKIIVIPNGYDEERFDDRDDYEILNHKYFNIAYTGLLSAYAEAKRFDKKALKRLIGMEYQPVLTDSNTRSPKFFLEALGQILDSDRRAADEIRCHFVGPFSRALREQMQAFRYPQCVVIHGPASQDKANRVCIEADLLLLLQITIYCKGQICCTAVPGKLFNYIRSGTPILAPIVENDATAIINEHNAGIVVPPRDVQAIAAVVKLRLDAWRLTCKARTHIDRVKLRRYSRRELTGQLARVLKDSAGHRA